MISITNTVPIPIRVFSAALVIRATHGLHGVQRCRLHVTQEHIVGEDHFCLCILFGTGPSTCTMI